MAMSPQLSDVFVFQQCHPLFVGDFVRIRRPEAIRRFLLERKYSIPDLFRFPLDHVCEVVQKLLYADVFKNRSQARLKFPSLFENSFGQGLSSATASVQGQSQSQENITTSDQGQIQTQENTAALKEQIAQMVTPQSKPIFDFPTPSDLNVGTTGISEFTRPKLDLFVTNFVFNIESNNPAGLSTDFLFFPYAVQHRVFSILKFTSEACCFEFLKMWLPDLDIGEGFEVPEQLELMQLTSTIEQHMHRIPNEAFLHSPGILLQRVLHQAYEIRDIADHRRTTSVKDMLRIVENTVKLTKMLKDENRSHLIEGIQKALATSTAKMMRQDQYLRARLVADLARIAEERRVLDATQKDIVANFTHSEKENRHVMGNAFMESLSVFHASTDHGSAETTRSTLREKSP